MRCTAITTTGDRCREQRPEWLRYVEQHGRLRCICTVHLKRVDRNAPVISAMAMCDFFVNGGESSE